MTSSFEEEFNTVFRTRNLGSFEWVLRYAECDRGEVLSGFGNGSIPTAANTEEDQLKS